MRDHVDGYLRTEPGKPIGRARRTRLEATSSASTSTGAPEHPSDDVMTELLTAEFEDEHGVRAHPDPR